MEIKGDVSAILTFVLFVSSFIVSIFFFKKGKANTENKKISRG